MTPQPEQPVGEPDALVTVVQPLSFGDRRPIGFPTIEQLALMRSEARDAGGLQGLRQAVAALQDVAKRCHLAFEEMCKLATFRLEVERDLGATLAQTVRRGGVRSNCPRGSLLPDGVSWKQSAAYQKLAALPDDAFRHYVELSRDQRKLPSLGGALRYRGAKQPGPRPKPGRQGKAGSLPPAALDAISRIMVPDILVGAARVPAKSRVAFNADDVFRKLVGDVLIVDCPDPVIWLPKLLRLRDGAQIRQAIVVTKAEPWARWFATIQGGEASCCFVRSRVGADAFMLLHLGAGGAAFRVAMSDVGVVLHT